MPIQIGAIVPRVVSSYSLENQVLRLNGIAQDQSQHDALKELFWGANYETEFYHIQGTRFYAVDLTLTQRYVQYVQFNPNQGPRTGWYLLRGIAAWGDRSARGLHFPFTMEMVFLGTNKTLKQGFKMMALNVERNDWGI